MNKQICEDCASLLKEKVEGLKADERKIAEFGEWQAETYTEKMLVNAVLEALLVELGLNDKKDGR